MVETIKLGHVVLCGLEKVVAAARGIAGRAAVAKYGSVKAAAAALRCTPERIVQWLADDGTALPKVGGTDLWPTEPLESKSWKELQAEIDVAILSPAQELRPRRAAARFWRVDDSRLRRRDF